MIFREGDKVMQTKNNYQLEWEISTKFGLTVDKGMGIFNGDMGIIKEINDFAETMTVEFDEGRKVEYSSNPACSAAFITGTPARISSPARSSRFWLMYWWTV